MATTTFRKVTLISDNPYGVTLDDILESESVYYGTAAIRQQDLDELEEHSPTLTHEAVAYERCTYYSLGYDPRATAEIPTVKLLPDPETIELDPLPTNVWQGHGWCTMYVHFNRLDVL